MKIGGVLKNIAMDWNRSTVTKKKASVVFPNVFSYDLFKAIIWQILGVACEETLTCFVVTCVPQYGRKHITDSKRIPRTCFVLQSPKRWSTTCKRTGLLNITVFSDV
jgi:hypothetical protein